MNDSGNDSGNGSLNEGDLVRVRFSKLASRGDGIASEGLEKPVYAAGMIPGEEALVRIRKIRRNWVAVDVEEVTVASPDRVEVRCPLFSTCSGCQLQHIAYPRQLELKHALVTEHIAEASGLTDLRIDPVIGAEHPWHYRNHGRFTVKDGKLGFVRRFRHQWFEVPHCHIMEPGINDMLERLSGKLQGATQCNVRVGGAPQQPLMIQPTLEQPGVAEAGVQTGQPYLYEQLKGRRFRVSAASFFQVHRAQAEKLIDVVAAIVDSSPGGVLVDAYAGVGTFAALLADRVDKVIAIEESGPAVEDAKENLAGLANVELMLGKSEELLQTLEVPVDTVILDPPRSGCRPDALDAVAKRRAHTLIYVSCNPATLGRDLQTLAGPEGAFDLVRIQPVDMFPHTHHVECVAHLRAR